MSNPTVPSALHTLDANLQQIRVQIARLDAQAMARQSGFPPAKAAEDTHDGFPARLGRLGRRSRAFPGADRRRHRLGRPTHLFQAGAPKRLNAPVESFLAQVATALIRRTREERSHPGLFRPFRRVLLHDSTVEALPDHLADLFPGSSNQRKKKRAALKIQFIADLLNGTLVHCSLSGFTRNDQAAAPDILAVAQCGDLIIRDLGYFALPVMAALGLKGGYFLSRYKHGVRVYDLQGQPLDLVQELKTHGRFDREVLLGAEHVRARLVARPAPEAVANERRRKARANHDGRYQPVREHLVLMGWNIFLTNVSRAGVATSKFGSPVSPAVAHRDDLQVLEEPFGLAPVQCAQRFLVASIGDDQTLVLCVGLSFLQCVGTAGGWPRPCQSPALGPDYRTMCLSVCGRRSCNDPRAMVGTSPHPSFVLRETQGSQKLL